MPPPSDCSDFCPPASPWSSLLPQTSGMAETQACLSLCMLALGGTLERKPTMLFLVLLHVGPPLWAPYLNLWHLQF